MSDPVLPPLPPFPLSPQYPQKSWSPNVYNAYLELQTLFNQALCIVKEEADPNNPFDYRHYINGLPEEPHSSSSASPNLQHSSPSTSPKPSERDVNRMESQMKETVVH